MNHIHALAVRGRPRQFTAAALLLAAGIGGAAGCTATEPANAHFDHVRSKVVLTPAEIDWSPAPGALPGGAELAVLDGDLEAGAPFVARLRMPDGYRIPRHTHPHGEWVTVIEGTVHLLMGDERDESRAEVLPAGSFVAIPAGVPHLVWVEGRTVIEVTAIGPFGIDYLNPAEDPQHRR